MEVWPESLPQNFSAADYTDTLADNTVRSEMDSGPAKVRRVSTSKPSTLSGTMVMTTAQWNEFVAFRRDTLREVLSFEFPNPEDDGETTLIVRLTSAPSRTQWVPGVWRVNLQMEVLL